MEGSGNSISWQLAPQSLHAQTLCLGPGVNPAGWLHEALHYWSLCQRDSKQKGSAPEDVEPQILVDTNQQSQLLSQQELFRREC